MHQARRWTTTLCAAALLAGTALSVTIAAPFMSGTAAAFGPASDWTVYHQNPAGSGVDPSGASFTDAGVAWTSPVLDGQLYGEPLEEGGLVIVATENDTVYALDVNTGAVVWSNHLATPVAASSLPCGDITPTVGITSTPVIDPSRSEVFVVDDELTGTGGAAHHLYGLDLSTGTVELNQVVDPPGSYPLYQLQRPGLALDDGQVIIGFGGNGGDCETPETPYHGWLAAVPEAGGTATDFEVASEPNDSQGAIWQGGAAPEVDSSGNIWVTTGNSAYHTAGQPYDDSDGVLEFSPSLTLEQYFAPADWYTDNAHDYDLSSVVPALLSDGLAFQSGKSQTGYVLSQSDLGGIGGQMALIPNYCGSTVDGGPAVVGNVVYEPCETGVEATQVSSSPPGISVLWKTPTGSGGPPIVAGGLVWTIDHDTGYLYGLNPATGRAVEFFSLGPIANHFPTPSVADGLLLAPSADQVTAFAAGYATNPPGNLSLYKSTALIGNLIDRVGGTLWSNNGDGSVDIYQCAGQTYSAGSCSALLASVNVLTEPSTMIGHFPATDFKLAAGVIDTNGDTCGLSGSPQCYVVVVGSNGDSNSLPLHFSAPAVTLHKPMAVVGNTRDAVAATHFPIGDTVMAEECDAAVNPASPSSNCDGATVITGHAETTGTVVWSASGIKMLVGADYIDPSGGTCNPGTTCDVVLVDETNPAITKELPVGFARPTVTLSPITVPNANGETIAVTAKNFPVGETVDALECDTAYTLGSSDNCDGSTRVQGVANSAGTVMGVAWSPTRVPVYTTATTTPYADMAFGSCSPGDTVGNMRPCYIGTTDAGNAAVAVATPFSVT